MKPIHLTIAGLHSFRQKEVIDFTKLTNSGIFGIFGKTGSGKSSILDAITLALYGYVERNPNRVGIINLQEKEVEVKFTFALRNGNNYETYTVERVYKKMENNRTNSRLARLIKHQNNPDEEKGHIVISDQESKVTKDIEQLIGLNVHDFTRSVVLPQGKFAEFLTLKPSERRQMLERLFRLEQYGEKLRKKAKEKEDYLTNEKNLLLAQQNTLDVTKEKVEEAKNTFEELKNISSLKEKEYAEILKTYEEKEKIFELKKKRTEILSELNFLLAEEGLIKELEQKKERNEKAQSLAPLISQYDEITTELRQKESNLLLFTKNFQELSEELDNQQKIKEISEEKLEHELPLLNEKLFKMNEILNLESEIKKLHQVIKELKEKAELKKKEFNALNSKILENNLLLTNNKTKLQLLKEKLQKIEVSFTERENLTKAQLLNNSIKHINDNKNKLLKKLNDLKNKDNEYKVKSEDLYKELSQVETELKKEKEELAELSENERQKYLLLFADELVAFEPCPVCGSTTHPAPFRQSEALHERDDEEKRKIELTEQIKLLESKQQELLLKQNSYAGQKELISQEITNTENELTGFELDYQELSKEWETNFPNWQIDKLAKIEQEIRQRDLTVQELQKEIQNDENEKNRLEKLINELNSNHNQLQQDLTKLTTELKLKTEEKEKMLSKWQEETKGEKAELIIVKISAEINKLKNDFEQQKTIWEQKKKELQQLEIKLKSEENLIENFKKQQESLILTIEEQIKSSVFRTIEEVKANIITDTEIAKINEKIKNYHEEKYRLTTTADKLNSELQNQDITNEEWKKINEQKITLDNELENLKIKISNTEYIYNDLIKKYNKWEELEAKLQEIQKELTIANELVTILKGNALVDFIALEQLTTISQIASDKLKMLTRNQYRLNIDQDGGFSISDDYNGGDIRPVQSLSGGETFLTSLALALALSAQIMLKGGQHLEFFFLDEGFGTLDSDLLDTVMNSLERLQAENMTIGVITHVPELQNRIQRKIIVKPADLLGNGTKIKIE